MRKLIVAALAAGVVISASPALAHVTVQPNEAIVGSFSRFVVRVPNERDNASTTKVTVELPPLAFVSFEEKAGWTRRVEEGEFAEPVQAFGDEVTEGIVSVTWSGGNIGPGEFAEFGFSAKMPDTEADLEFGAIQTYSNGEVVEWTGTEDSEEPAPHLKVYDIGAAEGEGELAVLARVAGMDHTAATSAPASPQGDDDTLPLVLGGLGFLTGAAALVISARRRT